MGAHFNKHEWSQTYMEFVGNFYSNWCSTVAAHQGEWNSPGPPSRHIHAADWSELHLTPKCPPFTRLKHFHTHYLILFMLHNELYLCFSFPSNFLIVFYPDLFCLHQSYEQNYTIFNLPRYRLTVTPAKAPLSAQLISQTNYQLFGWAFVFVSSAHQTLVYLHR